MGTRNWQNPDTISACGTTGVGAKVGAEGKKFYGGVMSMGTAAAGQAANYGVHAAYSLAQGGTLKDAYENMGGVTLNIANLGSMIDMMGSGIARNSGSGQSTLGKIRESLSGTGLLELNIGSGGVSMQFGMGGIDVGGALYDLGKRGIDKAALEKYKKENVLEGEAAYTAYVYGDWTQENTAARIAVGKDELIFCDGSGKGEMWQAQTTRNGSGGPGNRNA